MGEGLRAENTKQHIFGKYFLLSLCEVWLAVTVWLMSNCMSTSNLNPSVYIF